MNATRVPHNLLATFSVLLLLLALILLFEFSLVVAFQLPKCFVDLLFSLGFNLSRAVIILVFLDLLDQLDGGRLNILQELDWALVIVLLANITEFLLDLTEQIIAVDALLLLLGGLLGSGLLIQH